jgi:hypothetical protein
MLPRKAEGLGTADHRFLLCPPGSLERPGGTAAQSGKNVKYVKQKRRNA